MTELSQFENELIDAVSVVEEAVPIVGMILMEGPNPFILVELEPRVRPDEVIQSPVEQERTLDDVGEQQKLRLTHEQAAVIHDDLWRLIPEVVGFQAARDQAEGELNQLFKEVPVQFEGYSRALTDCLYAASVKHIARRLGLSAREARMILRSKLYEVKQTKSNRPNAGTTATQ